MRTSRSRSRSRLFAITAAALLVLAPAASASAASFESAAPASPSLVQVKEPVMTPQLYICSVPPISFFCRF